MRTELILEYWKHVSLKTAKAAGLLALVRNSRWRRRQLLILCYHGISLEDEHEWNPLLFMSPQLLEQRLALLKRGGYALLPLDEALERLYRGELPPRSVALTFDDGNYDFYKQAYPLLKHYAFPATVYQTTYYTSFQRPIFRLICSYMLWKRRGSLISGKGIDGIQFPLDLRSEPGRKQVVLELAAFANKQNLSVEAQDHLASQLAKALEIDYEALVAKRILQLMTPAEIAELSRAGVSFELHTHRHRVPLDRDLFRREIQDNRNRLKCIHGAMAKHFCYPSGIYRQAFLPWLAEEEVVSGATCDPGLASPNTNRWLLPRFVDTSAQPIIVFESWVSGLAALLAGKRNYRT